MHYVKIPKDTHLVNRQGKPVIGVQAVGEEPHPVVISHESWLNDFIFLHPRISSGGGNGSRRHRKLQAAFDDCKEDILVGIEDADFRVVRAVIDEMEYSPQYARYAPQLLPHIEAWEAADKQDDLWKKKYDTELKERANGSGEVLEAT